MTNGRRARSARSPTAAWRVRALLLLHRARRRVQARLRASERKRRDALCAEHHLTRRTPVFAAAGSIEPESAAVFLPTRRPDPRGAGNVSSVPTLRVPFGAAYGWLRWLVANPP